MRADLSMKPGCRHLRLRMVLLVGAAVLCTAARSAFAQPADAPDTTVAARSTLVEILSAGGIIGLLIFLLSIAAVALAIEHLLTIRASMLIPPGLSDTVRQLLAAGRLAEAKAACAQQPSLLAWVLSAGLEESAGGWAEVEKAVEEGLAEQSARLLRKTEYLSLIGNVAPMLGLLGTVVGMIVAFREVAASQGSATASDLAQGIYLALVTTVEGLIVAIPCVAAFAVFRNRIDQIMAEATAAAAHALMPLKRAAVAPPPQPPVGSAR